MFILVNFVNGFYKANLNNLRDEYEFPPSPDRLFRAVVAGYHNRRKATGKVNINTLLWFEKQKPIIHFNKYHTKTFKSWVPPILIGKKTKSKKEKIITLISTDKIIYEFPTEGPWEDIADIVQWIPHLGTSDSLVKIEVSKELLMPNSTTMEHSNSGGGKPMRVPYEGLNSDLDKMYAENSFRLPSVEVMYSKRNKFESPYEEVRIFGLEGANLDISFCSQVGGNLRNAIGKVSTGKLEEIIFNHKHEGFHLRFVSLPHITGRYPSNFIKGVAICIPRKFDMYGELDVAIRKIIQDGFDLKLNLRFQEPKDTYCRKLRLVEPRDIKTLQHDTWEQESDEWTTVTPIEMNTYSERQRNEGEHEAWIHCECERLGYGKVEKITFEYDRNLKFRQKQWKSSDSIHRKCYGFLASVSISFEKKIKGFVLLGKGISFGLGLMIPRSQVVNYFTS